MQNIKERKTAIKDNSATLKKHSTKKSAIVMSLNEEGGYIHN